MLDPMALQANILIDDSGAPCLADFGLTHLITTSTAGTGSTTLGLTNIRWAAPELLNDDVKAPTAACDVYAFGCVCVEVS